MVGDSSRTQSGAREAATAVNTHVATIVVAYATHQTQIALMTKTSR